MICGIGCACGYCPSNIFTAGIFERKAIAADTGHCVGGAHG